MRTTLRKILKQIRDEIENAKLLTTSLHDELEGTGKPHDKAFRAERSSHRALDSLNDVLATLKGEAGDEQLTLHYA